MNYIFYTREVLTTQFSQTICPGLPVSPANDMALQSFCPFVLVFVLPEYASSLSDVHTPN
jgi:hypothetical protein